MQSDSRLLTNRLLLPAVIREGKALIKKSTHFNEKQKAQRRVSWTHTVMLYFSPIKCVSFRISVFWFSLPLFILPKKCLIVFLICMCNPLCNPSPFCDVGKWLRVPGHRGSYCGGSGRKCSCSGVQRRPGNETSRQGGPGIWTCSSSSLWACLNSHMHILKFRILMLLNYI